MDVSLQATLGIPATSSLPRSGSVPAWIAAMPDGTLLEAAASWKIRQRMLKVLAKAIASSRHRLGDCWEQLQCNSQSLSCRPLSAASALLLIVPRAAPSCVSLAPVYLLQPLLHLHKHGRSIIYDSTCASVQVQTYQRQLLCQTCSFCKGKCSPYESAQLCMHARTCHA